MPPTSTDEDHLRLLTIFHFIVGGITAFFACFPLLHVGFGIFALVAPQAFDSPSSQPMPSWFGLIFILIGGTIFLLGQTLAVCVITAGRYLKRRVRYNFVFVVACLECVMMPFGTILGIFSIIVLSRPSVKRMFLESHGAQEMPPPRFA